MAAKQCDEGERACLGGHAHLSYDPRHANARTAVGGRRSRRASDRLPAPQRRLRHRDQGQRVFRGPAIHDRTYERRAVVHRDAYHRSGRARTAARARGTRRRWDAESPAATTLRFSQQTRMDACPTTSTPRPTSGHSSVHERQVARGRSSANGFGHRDRRRTRGVPQAPRRPQPAISSSVEWKASESTPEFRERDRLGFAFMTNEISSERRVETGVARIADMIARPQAQWWADRRRGRSGRRAHRRGAVFLRPDQRRFRRRFAGRQRPGRSRRRKRAVRHLSRCRSTRAGPSREATAIT